MAKMGKHKKTRREKKIADNRHTLYHLETSTAQEKITVDVKPVVEKSSITASHPKTQVVSYSYIMTDVKKITLVSTVLIFTQFAIFFILQRV